MRVQRSNKDRNEAIVVSKNGERVRQKSTTVEAVYAFVKRCIMDFALRPGDSIGDTVIAKQMGISRTPVREALRQLELEGLVVHTPRRGWAVRALDLQDVENMFEIKECIETMLVRRATSKLTSQDKGVLKKVFRSMEEAAASEDAQAWLAADARLESTFYAAAGNPRAQQILSSLNTQWHWIWLGIISLADRMHQSTREHGMILERVYAGDADGAAALALDHLQSIKRLLLTVLTRFVFPVKTAYEKASLVAIVRRNNPRTLVASGQ